jgi:hypothetical protein
MDKIAYIEVTPNLQTHVLGLSPAFTFKLVSKKGEISIRSPTEGIPSLHFLSPWRYK